MSSRAALLAATVCLLVFSSPHVAGTEWFVDGSVAESGDGQTAETAFKTIQEGINAASDGDTVTVVPGNYVENVLFLGRNIVLRSTDPLDADVVSRTIIDGNREGSVVRFFGSEDETCVLEGCTIRNGRAHTGAGIYGQDTRATIRENIVRANGVAGFGSQNYGGGISQCHGVIEKNIITGNQAREGAGLFGCNGTIRNNWITDNTATWVGGGFADCDAIIEGNVIANNSAQSYGGGLYECLGTIRNNTIAGNSSGLSGGGVYSCSGVITNCVIWGNLSLRYGQTAGSSLPTYSCIQHWEGGGEGNMSFCPYFVSLSAENFHLRNWSPCVDAGDPSSEFSNEPEPNGGRINMGAYGNTVQATPGSADTDGDSLPDDWEIHLFGNLDQIATGDADADGVPNLEEYRRGTTAAGVLYVSGALVTSGDGFTQETAFKTITEAIVRAAEGDKISVLPGHYVERFIIRKSLSLIGSGPEVTVIDADGKPGAIALVAPRYKDWDSKDPSYDRERKPFRIEGFAIANSANDALGAIHCFYGDLTLKDCEIRGNSGKFGAGLFLEESSAEITGCEMSENSAEEAGGAIYAWASEVLLRGCVIHNNTAENAGSPDALPGEGGGIACWHSSVRMVRTLVAGNSAARGGGIFCEECPIILVNCTIADNTATEGAGGIHCETAAPRQALPLVSNSIVWGNGLAFSAPLGPEVSYSDIEDAKFAGKEGNISQSPLFANPSEGDYSLQESSPCIDAGNPDPTYNDEDGSPCDMGAYGGTGQMSDVGLEPRAAHVTTEADSEGHRSLVVYWLGEPSASFLLQWKEDMGEEWPPGVSVEADDTWLQRWLHEYGMDLNRRLFYRIGR